MTDELKPCPFCGGEARHYAPGPVEHHIECVKCYADIKRDTEAEAIAAWNRRADEPQVIATSEKYEQADSREQLEADIQLSAMHLEFDDGYRSVEKVLDMVPLSTVYTWLDRQAAITRDEVFEDGYFDCLTCDAKVELRGEIDRLTAERDNWANCYDMAAKREQSLLSKIDSLTAECTELKTKLESYGKVTDQDEHEKQQPMESVDSRERLEADVYDGFSDVALSEQMRDVLRARVHAWLVRQELITEEQTRYRMADWKSETERLEAERDQLQEQHGRQVKTIERLTAERDGLKARVKFQQSQIDASHLAFKIAKEEYDKLDHYCDELKAERDELSNAVDKLRNQVDSLEEEAESHKRTANGLHNEVEYLAGQLAELTAERDELRYDCRNLRKRLADVKRTCYKLRKQLAEEVEKNEHSGYDDD